jgi:hypothetical protein
MSWRGRAPTVLHSLDGLVAECIIIIAISKEQLAKYPKTVETLMLLLRPSRIWEALAASHTRRGPAR